MATTFRASALGRDALAAVGAVLVSTLTAASNAKPEKVRLPEPTSAPK